jgi:uncharacterized protein involved in outer membrane biogenesis
MRVPPRTWITVAVVVLLAVVIALFEWNWLRGPLSSYMSARLGRPFAIEGDLNVELAAKPTLFADAVTVSNVPGSNEPVMLRAKRVALRVDPASLFGGPVALADLTLVEPRLLLERDANGHGNWEFSGVSEVPRVDRLVIEDGVVRYVNADTATDITLNVESSAASASAETPVHFSGKGRLRSQPFTVEGDAASLLALEQGERPYRVNAQMRAGDTRARFDGTMVPSRLDNVDGSLAIQGRDMSQLYPIVPVPFPWTPPYRLSGQLKHAGKVWSFSEFTGKVGDSDLAGSFTLDVSRTKPFADADLVSTRLDSKDLGGLLNLPPANEAAEHANRGAEQGSGKRELSERVLPTRPTMSRVSCHRCEGALQGQAVSSVESAPDNMTATLDLRDGVLKLQPIDFGVAGGHVASTLTLDARENLIKVDGDVTARNIELNQLIPGIKPPKGSAGKVGGQARFTAKGNSVADMLGSSNGEVALISRGGDASKLAVVLTNLDLARATQLLLRGDTNSEIHCIVANFAADDGTLYVRRLIMDTEVEKVVGDGSVDLARERYDLTLNGESKRPSILALRGPIVVQGTFKSPRVQPAMGPIAARVGASVALGVALTPIAALLPLIDAGGHEDADCGALMKEATDNVQSRGAGPKPSAAQVR